MKPAPYELDPRGHVWELDEDGTVNRFALDYEDEDGRGHNGPRCTVCGHTFCVHCAYEPGYGPDTACPGPPKAQA